MKQKVRELYFENTLFSFVFLAVVILFINVTFPNVAAQITPYVIPLFIIVTCIEIYFIRDTLIKKLSRIEQRLDNQFIFQSFDNGEDFDVYFANRLKSANTVKIIHLGSYVPAERENRKYLRLLHDFIRSGKSVQRIISKTNNPIMMNWIRRELEEFKYAKYTVYYTDQICTNDIRTMGIVIIDNEDVILGGSHYNPNFPKPLISTRNLNLGQFYLDYFSYLRDYSRPITFTDDIFQ